MVHVIVWILTAWAALSAFAVIGQIGKHRKIISNRMASAAVLVVACQIIALVYINNQL